ncbi:MAG: PleD family two-component system response regulator [Planctomycetota bacterium]
MLRTDALLGLVHHLTEAMERALVRSWSAFLGGPVFVKGAEVRAVTVDRLLEDIDRTLGVFSLEVTGQARGTLLWILDFQQVRLMLARLMRDSWSEAQDPSNLKPLELQALEGLALQGARAVLRTLAQQDNLEASVAGARVHFFHPDQRTSLSSLVPEGLPRVVRSHFEIFGHGSSSLITIWSAPLLASLNSWASTTFSPEQRATWMPRRNASLQAVVVDGSATSTRLVEEALTANGVAVKATTAAAEAMQLVETKVPDLVFCDAALQGQEALTLARWIRQRTPTKATPLIFCGADASKAEVLRALQAGASDFLIKPVTADKVSAILKKHLPESAS